jgi:hypothetical protein
MRLQAAEPAGLGGGLGAARGGPWPRTVSDTASCYSFSCV